MEKKVILIAEDEDINFLLLKYILEKEDFSVVRAVNGIEALDIFHSGIRIDLIIMDIKMPAMTGLDATREIRKHNRDLPIIALTAFALPGDREVCLEAGSNDYISKPINQADFIRKINKLLAV